MPLRTRRPDDSLPPVQSLDALLEISRATDAFKAAVRALAAREPQELIRYNPGSPPIKVMRFVMKALESCPEFPFERVEVLGDSGCSSYCGSAVAWPGPARFSFDWDCKNVASRLGWLDPFGDPDQARAARMLDYQCFGRFEVDFGDTSC